MATNVGFVDVEQASAFSFLLTRSIWLELPLFSYIGFMVRAAEAPYDDGDLILEAALSERANQRLRDYCRAQASPDFVPRPITYAEGLIPILEARLLLASLEATRSAASCNCRAADVAGLFDWAESRYETDRTRRGQSGLAFERFLVGEIIQTFDEGGAPLTVAMQTSKFARSADRMRGGQVKEVQANCIGVLMMELAAWAAGIPPPQIFAVLALVLQHSELLMVLNRPVGRLPRGTRAGAVASGLSSLLPRLATQVSFIRAMKMREVVVPVEVRSYSLELDDTVLAASEARLEQGAPRYACDATGHPRARRCRGRPFRNSRAKGRFGRCAR